MSKAGSIINPNPSSLYGYVNFADPANPFVTKFSSSDKAKYYDLNIKFNYKEIEIANPSNFEMKSIFFRVDGVEKQSNNSLEIPVSYTTFYSALRRLIPVNPFVKREAEPLDFVLVGGAEEL
ncbi:MAG TPA: hypothetical protein PKX84_00195, partial [Bacteroidia bacterium]|nr:hypothetical protein [Bacteroidia bacterium]